MKIRSFELATLFRILMRLAWLAFATSTICHAAPANDDFANAQAISGKSGFLTGTNVNATRQIDEPLHTGYFGQNSVWYRWTVPESGLIEISLLNAQVDAMMAVYIGEEVTSLTSVGSYYTVPPFVTLSADAGDVYYIAIDSSSFVGSFVLKWRIPPPPPANDNFAAAEVISGESGSVAGTTESSTREDGEPFHRGYYDNHTVWYRWDAIEDGTMQFYVFNGEFNSPADVYTGNEITALTRDPNQNFGSRTISVTAGTTYWIAVAGEAHQLQYSFVLNWRPPPPPPANDNFAAAEVISGESGSVAGTTESATREADEPSHSGLSFYHSIWYRWDAIEDGAMHFYINNGDFDPLIVVKVYTGTEITNLTQIPNQTFDSPLIDVTAETTYWIAVESYEMVESFNLNWYQVPPPPANDNFVTAESLGTVATISVPGTVRSATSEALGGEPDLSFNDYWENDRTVWYEWTAPAETEWAQVMVSGINLRNQLAVYTGNDLSALMQISLNERLWIRQPNRCTIPVIPNTTYRIRILIDSFAESGMGELETPNYDFNLQVRAISQPNTATDYILRGRGHLILGTPASFVDAKVDFAAALALETTNQEAAVLLALTQLLALEGETGFSTLLNQLGIPVTGSLRGSGYTIPEDLNGFPDFAEGADSSQALAWLVEHVLPRLVEVRSALNVVTQNSFRTDLTESEGGEGAPDVETLIDRGDALAMKAGTRALEMLIHLLSTYNLATPLNDLVELDRLGELSAEQVLATYQNLLDFATSDRRVQFADAMRELENDYVIAAGVIRDLRASLDEDDLGTLAYRLNDTDSASLQTDLSTAVDALDQEVLVGGNRVNLSRFLVTPDSFRDWLPGVRNNEVLGAFPDPTFDGILPDNGQQQMNNGLYELGRLWGMAQYTAEVGGYLEYLGLSSAPAEDADQDGKSNFEEWIFGSYPETGEVMHQAELAQTIDSEGEREIRFSFIRTMNLQDWRLIVAVSDDLATWDDTEATVEPVGPPVPTGDGFSEVVTYRLKPQVSLPQRKYFRVESRPNP